MSSDYYAYQAGQIADQGAVSEPWPCCKHCIDGDGMLPCHQLHDEPCGDCGWSDAEIAEWRASLEDGGS